MINIKTHSITARVKILFRDNFPPGAYARLRLLMRNIGNTIPQATLRSYRRPRTMASIQFEKEYPAVLKWLKNKSLISNMNTKKVKPVANVHLLTGESFMNFMRKE